MSHPSPPMQAINAVVVDDEPLAREGLRLRLLQHPHVKVIAECGDMQAADTAIKELEPDVLFLDIEMPGINSLAYLQEHAEQNARKGAKALPWVIFVTAYHNYAVDAFNVNALDYLVKPVEQHRLAQALDKLNEKMVSQKLLHTNDATQLNDDHYSKHLIIKESQGSLLVPCESVDWIEAAGDYMGVHAEGKVHILRTTMKDLERELNPTHFKRIHRSIIVNTRQIERISPHTSGESFLHLKNGDKLKVSRSYKNRIRELL